MHVTFLIMIRMEIICRHATLNQLLYRLTTGLFISWALLSGGENCSCLFGVKSEEEELLMPGKVRGRIPRKKTDNDIPL
jgi:hypothetical protein